MGFPQAEARSWARLATLVTPVTVAAVVVRFGLDPRTPAFCYLAALGVPLAFIDVREHRLPASQRASTQSLLVRLESATARNKKLAAENRQLRRQPALALDDQRGTLARPRETGRGQA